MNEWKFQLSKSNIGERFVISSLECVISVLCTRIDERALTESMKASHQALIGTIGAALTARAPLSV